jgi:glycosyltransferase involved in cell wall biosynthesis
MHHEYFPHVVKYDHMINYFSTKIIAVSENIRTILIEKENVQSKKINVIYHGFDLSNFDNVNTSCVIELQKKYSITPNMFVVGMISRYTHWKGIQYVIPAFKKLLKEFPQAVLVLANASGDYEIEIKSLLKNLPEGSYREILFEKDSPSLFKMFNVFVHVPIDDHSEAFGQVYVEALAAKCPSIFTISGIAKEFIIPDKNSIVVPFCNSEAIYFAMKNQLLDPTKSESLVLNGFNDVHKQFAIEIMIDKTLEYYAN